MCVFPVITHTVFHVQCVSGQQILFTVLLLFRLPGSSSLAATLAAILGLHSLGILQGQRSRGFFWPSAMRQVFLIQHITNVVVVVVRKPCSKADTFYRPVSHDLMSQYLYCTSGFTEIQMWLWIPHFKENVMVF